MRSGRITRIDEDNVEVRGGCECGRYATFGFPLPPGEKVVCRLAELESELADADLVMKDALAHKHAEIDDLKKKLTEAALDEVREDNRRAKRLAGQVTLDTQSAEEAMSAVLALLDAARKNAKTLAYYGIADGDEAGNREWLKARDIALAYSVEL